MTQASSAVTGGISVTVATIAPIVKWALDGLPSPMPESLPWLIAAMLVTVGHLSYNLIAERLAIKSTPEAPTEKE